jgi:hypothetical protein
MKGQAKNGILFLNWLLSCRCAGSARQQTDNGSGKKGSNFVFLDLYCESQITGVNRLNLNLNLNKCIINDSNGNGLPSFASPWKPSPLTIFQVLSRCGD